MIKQAVQTSRIQIEDVMKIIPIVSYITPQKSAANTNLKIIITMAPIFINIAMITNSAVRIIS